MPTRKKMSATEVPAEVQGANAAVPKPAPRRRTAKKTGAAAPAPEVKKAETKAKPAKSPAATHKSGTKRSAAAESKKAVEQAPFSVEAHRAEIEREAYFLFANRGFRHGRHADDWHQAIEIVRARYPQA